MSARKPSYAKLALLVDGALPYVEQVLAAQGDNPDRILVALQHEMAAANQWRRAPDPLDGSLFWDHVELHLEEV